MSSPLLGTGDDTDEDDDEDEAYEDEPLHNSDSTRDARLDTDALNNAESDDSEGAAGSFSSICAAWQEFLTFHAL